MGGVQNAFVIASPYAFQSEGVDGAIFAFIGADCIGELIDDDKDVWCDNDISVSHDRPECESTSFKLCQAGYELYMLWLLTLPAS